MNAKLWKLIISAILATALILIFTLDLLSHRELRIADAVFQRPAITDPYIVVVGIDSESLEHFGRFQDWNRTIFAEAIDILNSDPDSKPAVILLDVLFIEDSADPAHDEALADAARRAGNVITGAWANYGLDRALSKTILSMDLPFPALAAVSEYGLVNGTLDKDGFVRRALLWDEFEGERYYSLSAKAYKMLTGERGDIIENHQEMYIPYSGYPGEYMQWSFHELFDPDFFHPAFFEDCIVMIGAFAAGMMDSYYTPLSADMQMHGVEIHANALQALLDGNLKLNVPWEIKLAGYLLILAAAFALVLFLGIHPALIGCAVLFVAQIGVSVLLYNAGWVYMIFYPSFAIMLTALFKVIFGYVVAVLEKQKVRGIFMKYVDPKLVDKLIESGEADSNEVGALRDVAVLFVDVRGFTTMTEALKDNPETVVQILNEYLELTSASIFNNGGSVDKFIGDATMALFNGFVHLDDYEYKAVKAACDIVAGSADLCASIQDKYGVSVGFGIGVHCGKAIVGNLGPSFRKDYTAIGDTVNTTARLESNAQRSQVLISKEVYDRLGGRVKATSVGELPLKGKSEKLEIFAVDEIL
jgi:adenylate cyclase